MVGVFLSVQDCAGFCTSRHSAVVDLRRDSMARRVFAARDLALGEEEEACEGIEGE